MQMASGMMSMSSAPGSVSRALRAFATSLGMALAFRGALFKQDVHQKRRYKLPLYPAPGRAHRRSGPTAPHRHGLDLQSKLVC